MGGNMRQLEQQKTPDSPADQKRARGRPPQDGALNAAERARRYRAKQKAAGLIKRYVVPENTAATDLHSARLRDNMTLISRQQTLVLEGLL
jgi:hypothetical protein